MQSGPLSGLVSQFDEFLAELNQSFEQLTVNISEDLLTLGQSSYLPAQSSGVSFSDYFTRLNLSENQLDLQQEITFENLPTLYQQQQKEIQFYQDNQAAILQSFKGIEPLLKQLLSLHRLACNAQAVYVCHHKLNELNIYLIKAKLAHNNSFKRGILNCQESYLTRFPAALLKDVRFESFFQNLTTLILRHNHIRTLPANIDVCLKLKTIDIHGNPLQTLPASIAKLPLQFFNCDNGIAKELQALRCQKGSGAAPLVIGEQGCPHPRDRLQKKP